MANGWGRGNSCEACSGRTTDGYSLYGSGRIRTMHTCVRVVAADGGGKESTELKLALDSWCDALLYEEDCSLLAVVHGR
ncbi:hypothetical protein MUK42_20302 [Musa troglodytarum]|uniref:Uncharacterized protein n=1 Tax=Musa troglodytarum TaxID=320322 RepID=A0A9E7FWU5_9LILI|nr:hypothetical protein MUK42_20302 [Musa troglodytarum]